MPLDALESVVNEISDKDRSWWPFLWLRPAKHERMSLRRLVSIAILYGLPCGAALAFLAWLALPNPPNEVAAPIVGFPVLLLFAGTVVVGPMWNRRAHRLERRRAYASEHERPAE